MTTNDAAFARARQALAGGVDSPVRSFAQVGGVPYTVASGAGAYVTDVEGRRYIDFVQSYGASLLGHADPRVTAAIASAAARGATFGAPTEAESALAEAIKARVAGLERLRFVSSGTEAVMSAVRLARGATGRDVLIKFDGGYHGHADQLLVAAGSGAAHLARAASAGVTAGAIADTRTAPYNEVPPITADVACVLVEPIAANMNLVAPVEGFLHGLREACDRAGALLIFDEVITGFRLGPGGAAAAYDVRPDLWCFGKVIGGGLPVGAFGGSAALMAHLAPEGDVYQAGTLSGNPVAMAAGLAVLEAVTAADYAALADRVARFAAKATDAARAAGLGVQMPVVGPLCGLFVTDDSEPPRSFTDVRAIVEREGYRPLFHALLDRGVALAPGPYEVLFPSLAHSDEVLARTVEAVGEAAATVVAA